jgi:septal ring factor EnvC (AmiA/AmiB activator)
MAEAINDFENEDNGKAGLVGICTTEDVIETYEAVVDSTALGAGPAQALKDAFSACIVAADAGNGAFALSTSNTPVQTSSNDQIQTKASTSTQSNEQMKTLNQNVKQNKNVEKTSNDQIQTSKMTQQSQEQKITNQNVEVNKNIEQPVGVNKNIEQPVGVNKNIEQEKKSSILPFFKYSLK